MKSKPKKKTIFKCRLYVAGEAENSALALANLTAFCQAHLGKGHKIEVIDVFQNSKKALAEGILMTPTLIKYSPLPVRRIVGTLSNNLNVVFGLKPNSIS
ncbi:MAG TPA: circadian clock KaiB family protein [Aestuariivirga sp.]|jgi:circadian clock protein KaiB